MNVIFDEFIECNNGINETWESITNKVYSVYPFIDFNFKDVMSNMLGWVFDYELDVEAVSLTIINEIERLIKKAGLLI